MRTGSAYKLKLAVSTNATGEGAVVVRILFAECMPCPAGKAPKASCKHLAALMFALEEFSRLGFTKESSACTDVLQAWNKPHRRKAEPVKAYKLDWNRSGKTKCRKRSAAELFDPRASADRGKAAEAEQTVVRQSKPEKCGLCLVAGDFLLKRQAGSECGKLTVTSALDQDMQICRKDLVETLEVVWKAPGVFDVGDDGESCGAPSQPAVDKEREWYEKNVVIDEEGAKQLRKQTSNQVQCKAWFSARAICITASSVKRILHMKPSTNPAKLVIELTKPMSSFSTKAIEYGWKNESLAIDMYSKIMTQFSGTTVIVEPVGLVVQPQRPWLGASPDGVISATNGLVEIKCPFTCKEVLFEDIALQKKSTFCLKNTPAGLRLKSNHTYYYQVQTQLLVAGADYCDFVVWSPKQIHIERIMPDPAFVQKLDVLEKFYFKEVLPCLSRRV